MKETCDVNQEGEGGRLAEVNGKALAIVSRSSGEVALDCATGRNGALQLSTCLKGERILVL